MQPFETYIDALTFAQSAIGPVTVLIAGNGHIDQLIVNPRTNGRVFLSGEVSK